MANRDFFAFSTTLKPIELRALGALSQVRHLEPDTVIYRSGDRSDVLYIINRGMVEMVQEDGPSGIAGTYLSRGDMFGDVEVLTAIPRRHLVRTREEVSLQCFQLDDFPELVARVPSFFRYLCEHLANRLLEARDAALSRSHCLELSGSLTNFDLVTIYQTIVNSAQTGELSILDENGELLSAFYFEAGQPLGGQFQHLTGEDAFWQLFLAENLRGTFSFSSGPRQISQTIQAKDFSRGSDEMLINAVQGRDELRALRQEMPDGGARFRRLQSELEVGAVEPRLRGIAEEIWRLTGRGPMQLRDLYSKCSISELKIYQAVQELIATGHFELSSSTAEPKKLPNECKK